MNNLYLLFKQKMAEFFPYALIYPFIYLPINLVFLFQNFFGLSVILIIITTSIFPVIIINYKFTKNKLNYLSFVEQLQLTFFIFLMLLSIVIGLGMAYALYYYTHLSNAFVAIFGTFFGWLFMMAIQGMVFFLPLNILTTIITLYLSTKIFEKIKLLS